MGPLPIPWESKRRPQKHATRFLDLVTITLILMRPERKAEPWVSAQEPEKASIRTHISQVRVIMTISRAPIIYTADPITHLARVIEMIRALKRAKALLVPAIIEFHAT